MTTIYSEIYIVTAFVYVNCYCYTLGIQANSMKNKMECVWLSLGVGTSSYGPGSPLGLPVYPQTGWGTIVKSIKTALDVTNATDK